MSRNATLSCSCGEVRGFVTGVSPNTVNRVVCYCDDCQAFLHHLGRPELLDAQGGTDIVQIAPASLSFVQGEERIVGLRLGPKGLYRWYASCCRTPVGNTVGPAIPFVGVVAQAFESETQKSDNLFGRPIGRIYGKYAVGSAPEGSTWLMGPATPGGQVRCARAAAGSPPITKLCCRFLFRRSTRNATLLARNGGWRTPGAKDGASAAGNRSAHILQRVSDPYLRWGA